MSKILLYTAHNGYHNIITEKNRWGFNPDKVVYPSQLGEHLGDGIIQLWKNPKGEVWLSDDVKRLIMVSEWVPVQIDITRTKTPPPWWLKLLVKYWELG